MLYAMHVCWREDIGVLCFVILSFMSLRPGLWRNLELGCSPPRSSSNIADSTPYHNAIKFPVQHVFKVYFVLTISAHVSACGLDS